MKVTESRDRIVKRRAEKEEEKEDEVEEEETELKDGNNEDLFSVLVSNEACIGSFRQPIGRESAVTFDNNDVFSVCVSQPRASLPPPRLRPIRLVERDKKKKRKRKRVGRESSRIHAEEVRASRAVRVPPFTRAANSTRSLSHPFHPQYWLTPSTLTSTPSPGSPG